MKISKLIEELERIKAAQGDIEVTCTGSTFPDNHGGAIPDVFETTVENLVVRNDSSRLGHRVRLWL